MRARRSEIYILALCSLPVVDGVRSLRRGLKYLLRSCGLRVDPGAPCTTALSDSQLKIIIDAAASMPPERRGVFLERVGAMLKVRHRFDDGNVAEIAKLVTAGLVHQRTDA